MHSFLMCLTLDQDVTSWRIYYKTKSLDTNRFCESCVLKNYIDVSFKMIHFCGFVWNSFELSENGMKFELMTLRIQFGRQMNFVSRSLNALLKNSIEIYQVIFDIKKVHFFNLYFNVQLCAPFQESKFHSVAYCYGKIALKMIQIEAIVCFKQLINISFLSTWWAWTLEIKVDLEVYCQFSLVLCVHVHCVYKSVSVYILQYFLVQGLTNLGTTRFYQSHTNKCKEWRAKKKRNAQWSGFLNMFQTESVRRMKKEIKRSLLIRFLGRLCVSVCLCARIGLDNKKKSIA